MQRSSDEAEGSAIATAVASVAELERGLPRPQPVGVDEVRGAIDAAGRVLVVIDDDPTGTQAVSGVPLVTRWTIDDIRWALAQGTTAIYVLANTRSLEPDAARARITEIVRAVHEACAVEGVEVDYLSRSDSTLRGHFPLETDTIDAELQALGEPPADGVVLCPAFVEAGRVTVGDVHYAKTDDGFLPVGETEYACDRSFGYRSSHLGDFVHEKVASTTTDVLQRNVVSIDLATIRTHGPLEVANRLEAMRGGDVAIVNATCDDDMRAVSLALLSRAARTGKRFILRTGPSFVRARAGLDASEPLRGREQLYPEDRGPGHGLIVVGSHVSLSSRQLARLRLLPQVAALELSVPEVVSGCWLERRAAFVTSVVESLEHRETIVYTSRELEAAVDPLAVARDVSAALTAVVAEVMKRIVPRFVIGKGGITSSDLATDALDIRRAWAKGTVLPGQVALWQSVDGVAARTPYLVFPGNVGDDDSLARVVEIMREAA